MLGPGEAHKAQRGPTEAQVTNKRSPSTTDENLGPGEPISVDRVLVAAGVDIGAARTALGKLKTIFPDGIPDGALQRWVDEEFHAAGRAFWHALGRAWEAEV